MSSKFAYPQLVAEPGAAERRRPRRITCSMNRPLAVLKIKSRTGAQNVRAGSGQCIERADVAPIAALFMRLDAWDSVGCKVISKEALAALQPREYFAAEIGFVSQARVCQQVLERARIENVVAHGYIRARRICWMAAGAWVFPGIREWSHPAR